MAGKGADSNVFSPLDSGGTNPVHMPLIFGSAAFFRYGLLKK
jgi:hypothetical protein